MISVRDNSGGSQGNSTSPTFTLPTTIIQDDLILIIAGTDGTAVFTPPAGFTDLSQQDALGLFQTQVFGKISDGTEGGTTVNGTLSSSESSCYIALSVQEFEGGLASGIDVSAIATGTNLSAEPSAVTAGWGTDDNLFIAVVIGDYWDKIATAFPTNYTDNQLTQEHVNQFGGTQAVSIATRNLNAGSDDPDAFTLQNSVNNTYAAFTLVARPAASDLIPDQTNVKPADAITWTTALTGLTDAYLEDGNGNQYNLTSVTDTGGTIPALAPALGACLFGSVTLTVTDGTDIASAGVILDPPTGYSVVTLTSVPAMPIPTDWVYDFDIPAVVGDQGIFLDSSPYIYNVDGTTSNVSAGTDTYFTVLGSSGGVSEITKTFQSEGGSVPIGQRTPPWKLALYLTAQEGIEGAVNDVLYEWLGSLGYTGSLNDRWIQYWEALGYVGSYNDLREQWLKTSP